MKLNVLIGMEHFKLMIMMTILTIHTIVVPLQTAVLHLMKFLTKSHRVIYKTRKFESFKRKRRKRKDGKKNTVIKEKDETNKERTDNLDIHKNRCFHHLLKEYDQLSVVLLQEKARK